MPLPLILIAAAAAMQPSHEHSSIPFLRRGDRVFMSPMGEPFAGDASGNDGLKVWFAQADLNHDGAITLEEMTADAMRFFEVLDVNKDGEIGPEEITHYEESMEARSGRYSLLNIPEPVISADADLNRGVSKEEFRRAAIKRFDVLDLDHSGRLTPSELESVRDAAADQVRHPPGEKQDEPRMDPNADSQNPY